MHIVVVNVKEVNTLKKKKTLSLCTIVKDEEYYLPQCLASIKDVVDEIIIVDTGSTDRTVEIAQSFGAKVFYYTWENDFSKARNFAIEKSNSDWILLLDADEALDPDSKDKLRSLVDTCTFDGCHFAMHNYVGSEGSKEFTVHYPFRLLKNNHQYMFKGSIHEQIHKIDGESSPERFSVENILVHHYGYLNQVRSQKSKSARNLPLLLEQLKSTPNDPFHLFNLGNEYLALHEYEKGISTYEHALQYANINQSFTPFIYHKIVLALHILKDYDRALEKANEGILIYPKCTDLVYSKALILYDTLQYTEAIITLHHCIVLGEPPIFLKFIDGCGTYRPYLTLGHIYAFLESYEESLKAYRTAVTLNPNLLSYIYNIGEVLCKLYPDPHLATEHLKGYFTNLETPNNLFIFLDVLIKQKVYEEIRPFILVVQNNIPDSIDKQFVLGEYYFFTHQYDLATQHFEFLLSSPIANTLLLDIKKQSALFLFTIYVLKDKGDFTTPLSAIKELDEPALEQTYTQLVAFYTHEDTNYLEDTPQRGLYLKYLTNYLDILLTLKAYDTFQNTLPVLHYIHSIEVYHELAKLYARHHYKELAIQSLYQSISEFGTLTKEGAFILYQQL